MRPTLLLALTVTATLGATMTGANLSFAQTQEQTVQPATSATASVPTVPARGATMEGVKAKFGAPIQEAPPVGTPAITRWDYPGYAVFFENDKVLHTVIAR